MECELYYVWVRQSLGFQIRFCLCGVVCVEAARVNNECGGVCGGFWAECVWRGVWRGVLRDCVNGFC